MTTLFRRRATWLAFVLLAVCAPLAQHDPLFAQTEQCIGSVVTPPAGLVEVKAIDSKILELLKGAIDLPSKGKLCKGSVFVAEKPVTVYRVWDKSKAYTMTGSWWALEVPRGPRDKYRVDNDICEEWSPLDVMTSCTIKVGAQIVIGPGQSAQCANPQTLLPASAVNQVFIPNDTRAQPPQVFVENCTAGSPWPAN